VVSSHSSGGGTEAKNRKNQIIKINKYLSLIISKFMYKLSQITLLTKQNNSVKIAIVSVEAEQSSSGDARISDDAGILDAVCE